MYSVLLIDDHDIVRFGLEALIQQGKDICVVGGAGNLKEGLAQIERFSPQLVITDMSLPDSKGLDTVRAVVNAQKRRHVLVLSMHDEGFYANEVLKIGARGYLMKERAQEFVGEAIATVVAGEIWVSHEVNQQFLRRLHAAPSLVEDEGSVLNLTHRESEVMELLGKGLTTKELARALGISIRTVDLHRGAIKAKLGFKSSAEMIAHAVALRSSKAAKGIP